MLSISTVPLNFPPNDDFQPLIFLCWLRTSFPDNFPTTKNLGGAGKFSRRFLTAVQWRHYRMRCSSGPHMRRYRSTASRRFVVDITWVHLSADISRSIFFSSLTGVYMCVRTSHATKTSRVVTYIVHCGCQTTRVW